MERIERGLILTGIIMALFLIASALAAFAGEMESTKRQYPDYQSCLLGISVAAGTVDTAPINVVDTAILRIVRFPATDGSVLMTCTADGAMVITKVHTAAVLTLTANGGAHVDN